MYTLVIPEDRANHFIWGQIVFMVMYLCTRNRVVALLAATAVAAVKEMVHDKLLKRGDPNVGDFAATFVGAYVLFLVVA